MGVSGRSGDNQCNEQKRWVDNLGILYWICNLKGPIPLADELE